MKENNKHLIEESLGRQDGFSSTTHAIDTMAQEIPKEGARDYPIPARYYKDRVTLLPVNQSKYYLYWEVTDETLAAHHIDLNHQKLHFQVYDTNGMLFTFSSSFAVSEYFIKGVFENRKIYVKAGYMNQSEFNEILTSQTIQTFSSQINLPSEDDEIWMRRGGVWSELLHSSIEHLEFSGSSAKYIKELERLRYLTRVSQSTVGVGSSNMSSTTLHQGGYNG
ncbi:MAG: DUF4912 domain-containing protein [Campylobacterales bacterium]|nr:DUF4912 domain-containing protein [Campylobacterales bacterium]